MFPILAIIVVGYTLYKNVHGVPFPYNRFPFYVAAWLVVGLLIVLLWPGLSARIGATMARQEGISEEDAAAGREVAAGRWARTAAGGNFVERAPLSAALRESRWPGRRSNPRTEAAPMRRCSRLRAGRGRCRKRSARGARSLARNEAVARSTSFCSS